MTARLRAARLFAIVLGLALVALVVARCRPADPPVAASLAPSADPSARPSSRPRASPPPGALADLPRTVPPPPSLDPAMSRKERARFTLASYLDWAQYPPTSRPARERPDRRGPHAAPTRALPLKRAGRPGSTGGASSRTTVVLSQSHYYLSGDETAVLTVSCRKDEAPAPCTATGASAEVAPGAAGRAEAAAVSFTDDGTGPDRAANDNAWTAALTPSKAGFADVHGPILITVTIDAGDEQGTADFQISYTGKPPAIFTGAAREALERGSLRLCVELLVTDAGRYVIDGRVDDAGGETFAFVSFNDRLEAGKQEACFIVFGKLILDEGAKGPFKLRDVEGFLLLEDAFPDRRTLPTLEGAVHTTKAYAPGDFSKDEWQSPTKDRYVTQLKKDAEGDD